MAGKVGNLISLTGRGQRSAMHASVILTASVGFCLIAIALSMGASAYASKEVGVPGQTPTVSTSHKEAFPTFTKTPGANPTSQPGTEGNFTGWERLALRDLAEVVGWPTVVVYDPSGRLRVQDIPTPGEWTAAHVQAFDFVAGARAGFAAEQEDSRLAGYFVTQEAFFTNPAYTAVLTDRSGAVIETRFRWLASTSILGVDRHAPAGAMGRVDSHLIAEQLLSIATWRGLPPPPGGNAPTPNPTWSLPPEASPTTTPCGAYFSDVMPSYWAYRYIYPLACGNVLSGYGDGTFRPDNSTTRAQLAKMVVLGHGWTLPTPPSASFSDIPPSHPFFRYIEAAVSHGIISGYGDGTFRPDAFVTRAQVAKMIVRAAGWSTDTTMPSQLWDVEPDYWAYAYIQAAVRHGIFTGYGDNLFRPSMPATRAQLAKVLMLSVSP